MKKSILILGAAAVLALAGCGSTSVITPKFMENNYQRELFLNKKAELKFIEEEAMPEGYSEVMALPTVGMKIIANADGMVGVRDVVNKKWFIDAVQNLEIKSGKVTSYGVIFSTFNPATKKATVVDSFGHVIVDTTAESVLTITDAYTNVYTDAFGKRSRIIRITAANEKIIFDKFYDYTDIKNFKEVFFDIKRGQVLDNSYTDLTVYGGKGFIILGDDYVIHAYDVNKKYVGHYALPTADMINSGVIGTNFIYQTQYMVSKDAVDYTYSDFTKLASGEYVENKYVVETHILDLETLSVKDVNFDGVMETGTTTLKDDNGNHTLGYISYRKVLDNKALSQVVSSGIFDKGLKQIDDTTNIYWLNFQKLENGNYVDLTSNMLYKHELEAIISLSSTSKFIRNEAAIMVENPKTGYYGVIDYNGNVTVDTKYAAYCSTYAVNQCVLMEDALGDHYSVNVVTGAEKKITLGENDVLIDDYAGFGIYAISTAIEGETHTSVKVYTVDGKDTGVSFLTNSMPSFSSVADYAIIDGHCYKLSYIDPVYGPTTRYFYEGSFEVLKDFALR